MNIIKYIKLLLFGFSCVITVSQTQGMGTLLKGVLPPAAFIGSTYFMHYNLKYGDLLSLYIGGACASITYQLMIGNGLPFGIINGSNVKAIKDVKVKPTVPLQQQTTSSTFGGGIGAVGSTSTQIQTTVPQSSDYDYPLDTLANFIGSSRTDAEVTIQAEMNQYNLSTSVDKKLFVSNEPVDVKQNLAGYATMYQKRYKNVDNKAYPSGVAGMGGAGATSLPWYKRVFFVGSHYVLKKYYQPRYNDHMVGVMTQTPWLTYAGCAALGAAGTVAVKIYQDSKLDVMPVAQGALSGAYAYLCYRSARYPDHITQPAAQRFLELYSKRTFGA